MIALAQYSSFAQVQLLAWSGKKSLKKNLFHHWMLFASNNNPKIIIAKPLTQKINTDLQEILKNNVL